MCHVLDGSEVGGGVFGSDPAFVITEDHVRNCSPPNLIDSRLRRENFA